MHWSGGSDLKLQKAVDHRWSCTVGLRSPQRDPSGEGNGVATRHAAGYRGDLMRAATVAEYEITRQGSLVEVTPAGGIERRLRVDVPACRFGQRKLRGLDRFCAADRV